MVFRDVNFNFVSRILEKNVLNTLTTTCFTHHRCVFISIFKTAIVHSVINNYAMFIDKSQLFKLKIVYIFRIPHNCADNLGNLHPGPP